MNPSKIETPRTLATILLFALLAGSVLTAASYQFGLGNQVEQLPLILRAADSHWLSRDFFTNAASIFGPRSYYAQALAFASRFAPLPLLFLLLTLLCNVLVIGLTALTAYALFGAITSLTAAFMVAASLSLQFGSANFLTDSSLTPQLLAMPLSLAALWAILQRRPIVLVILSGLASLMQPLIGLEVGGLGLLVSAILTVYKRARPAAESRSVPLIHLIIGSLIYAVFAAFWIVPASATMQIDARQFIDILAYFRHPHHYVASTFPSAYLIELIFFVSAVSLIWFKLRKEATRSKDALTRIGVLGICILALVVGGYVFVELIPSRLWTTLQTFRLLFVFQWLGTLLFAAYVGTLLQASLRHNNRKALYDALLLISGAASPLLIGALYLLQQIRQPVLRILKMKPILLVRLLAGLVLIYDLTQPVNGLSFVVLVIFFGGFYYAITGASSVTRNAIVGITGMAYMACVGLIMVALFFPLSAPGKFARIAIAPITTFADISGPSADIAHYAQKYTPSDAIFLTPPDWGLFRLLAERAIVIDFKAFPFQDQAMVLWRQRLTDCYGDTAQSGLPAIDVLNQNYTHITDTKLWALQNKYAFEYAVLDAQTPTQFPVLFNTETFKLVRIGF